MAMQGRPSRLWRPSRAGDFVLLPARHPLINVEEMRRYGAEVHLHDGLIHECGAEVQEDATQRVGSIPRHSESPTEEGKKTMGLELAEQFDWQLPDYIFYPTGGGTDSSGCGSV